MNDVLKELVDQESPVALTQCPGYCSDCGEDLKLSGLYDVVDWIFGTPGVSDHVCLVEHSQRDDEDAVVYTVDPLVLIEQVRPDEYARILVWEHEQDLMEEDRELAEQEVDHMIRAPRTIGHRGFRQ